MADLIGKNLGPYQLIEFLARGDTAMVYKGFQPAMSRYVAIKVLPPSLARDEGLVRQFQRQAELMAQLEHRAILPVYDYARDEGLIYMVSRFAEGGSLAQHLADYRDLRRAVGVIQTLAEALDYVHARGLAHGNLRPSNVLLDGQRQPLLADFSFDADPALSRLGNVYISPEVAQGAPIDKRVDIYALGALLYEMLIGEAPPAGVAPTPRLKRPDLPPEVEKIILKAMAPYPDQRYETAGQMSQALEGVILPQTVPARAAEAEQAAPPEELRFPAPAEKSDQTRNWLLVLIAVLAGAVIICGALIFFFMLRGPGEESLAPTAAPGEPTLTALTSLNVRSGPSTAYEVLGVMTEGQSAAIVGSSPDGMWWAIRFPAGPSGQGWVAAIYTTSSNTENVPIVQPPPAPTGEAPTLAPTLEPPTLAPTLEPTLVPTLEPPTAEAPTAEPPTAELPTVELPTLAPTEGPGPEQPLVTPTTGPGAGTGGICGAPLGLAALVLLVVGLPMSRRRSRTGRRGGGGGAAG